MRARDTRGGIVRTARRLFLDEGVEAVTMRRIARSVRVSATAIYRHFRNKDELLDEIADEGFRIFGDYLSGALDAPSPVERVRRMGRRYLDFALDHPRHYDFLFLLRRGNVRTFPGDFARRDDLTFHILSREVEAAMKAGEIRTGDPLEAALDIWAHVHGLVALHRAGRFGRNEEEVRHQYTRSVERLLAGMTAPRPRRR